MMNFEIQRFQNEPKNDTKKFKDVFSRCNSKNIAAKTRCLAKDRADVIDLWQV